MSKRNVIRNAIFAAAVAYILICIVHPAVEKYRAYKAMDAREMNYDADGPFILVNITGGTVGYYIADEPQKHISHEIVIAPEDWVYYLGDGQTEIDDIKWLMENVPAGTPIAFYEEE